MEVDGISVEAALAIKNASVVGGRIEASTGHLTLIKGDASEIDAGLVRPPIIAFYPVGSIFMSVKPDNPAAFMGGGTWVEWGKGRVPVGVDTTQTEFDIVEKTNPASAKSVAIDETQMPSHIHDHTIVGYTGVNDRGHGHHGNTGGGGHEHQIQRGAQAGTGGGVGWFAAGAGASAGQGNTSGGGAHGHSFDTEGESTGHYHPMSYKGGGLGHNNLQPYITCYMWKRTL